ncbi:MAG: M43 family zinc metalloprotease [Bacteroidota bacterium]
MKRAFTLLMLTMLGAMLAQAQHFHPHPHPYSFDHYHAIHNAATDPERNITPCITDEVDAAIKAQFNVLETHDDFESWFQPLIKEYLRSNASRGGVVYTIPVIIHVVHNGEPVGQGNNISAAQVRSQIDVLNEDFRRLANTPGFNNHPDGADTEIEFCPAFVDSSGAELPESGVNRVSWQQMGFVNPIQQVSGGIVTSAGFTFNYLTNVVAPSLIWDPYRYMNIFVIPTIERNPQPNGAPDPSTGTILGFSRYPSRTGIPDLAGDPLGTFNDSNDGIYVRSNAFGRVGNVSSGTNAGRTSTHEAGHWLALHHPWGPSNDPTNCVIDDFCDDTPQKSTWTFSCRDENQCNDPDMFRNYMDYTFGTCQNIFTNDQTARMRTVLVNSPRRKELVTSSVCDVPTQAPTADFILANTNSCDGEFRFIDRSQGIPTNWVWQFRQGTTQVTANTRNPVVTLPSSGTWRVTLIVNNRVGTGQPLSRNVTVDVGSLPQVNVGPDLRACFLNTLQLSATTNLSNPTVTWSPTNGISDPRILNPNLVVTTVNRYIVTVTDDAGCSASDTINLNISPAPTVAATASASSVPAGTPVRMSTLTSSNIIGYSWTPNYNFISSNSLPVVDVAPDRTVTYTVTVTDNNGCTASDDVRIEVPGTVPLSIEDKDFQAELGTVYRPFPNPGNDHVTFSADFFERGDLQITLHDLTGKQQLMLFNDQIAPGAFDLKWNRPASVPGGMYMVSWQMDGLRFTQKVQLF